MIYFILYGNLSFKKNGGDKILNQKVLKYVDDVILIVSASKEFKMKLENELIRHIIVASENINIEEVLNKLGPPKGIADKMSRRLISEISKEVNKIFIEIDELNEEMSQLQDMREVSISENYECDHHNNHDYNHHRGPGEYVREDNNVNIKLLYIPLIQICSQMERIRLPYVDDSFFE